MDKTGSGVTTFPTIELGGQTYTLKFSRGAMQFGISKRGINTLDLNFPAKRFACSVELIHIVIEESFRVPFLGPDGVQFKDAEGNLLSVGGTVKDLATLIVDEGKIDVCCAAIREALLKVFPPLAPSAPQVAGQDQAPN